ncbi:MAG: ornithine cyclodeaminase family protein [SAR202 cluster bacterium]|nr:ornithine cyclodeaminase [Chloroflexota bacterium]MDP6421422.1 ornithine cyclodeaminase family protein [SAR202 cluster bacterium]HAL46907.1 ornithine cyclodeaminase [Dehalococcoidia bacterium]MDP6664798.1 ornithine cyclodeaminase family protein [SAR202 cluster bacterium]MDP6799288.1 ornithine cyclodeaminase family protein [SAR202 cluster bacterium]|tara:strand:- start:5989 stop:6948 length:960 start_codon:yes stop_codon:yes gene_type:complete
MPLLLTDGDIDKLMTMQDSIEVIEDSFRQVGEGDTWNRPRSRIRMPRGFHHLMAASVLGSEVFGLKTYTSFRAGTRFLVILYDSNTGDLLAMVQGGRLTQLRTGAVSAVATKYMARENAATVGIIGTGNQGRAQLAGVCGVRNVTAVKAYDRVEESVQGFIEEMSAELGVEITRVETAEEAVTDSDVVITMTTSRTPVLLGDWLQPGQHVNAAGSNHWIRQEVDDNVIRKADTIIVDSIEDAQVEAGDLLYPIERGRVRWSQIKELSDVVVGRVKGRESPDSITLFESQGLAVSDVAAAAYVYGKAKEQGLGVELPMSS